MQQRDPNLIERCKRDFLPERYRPYYFRIADNMDADSIGRIHESVFSDFEYPHFDSGMKIPFPHGTKGNESVSRKAAIRMKKVNPQKEIEEIDTELAKPRCARKPAQGDQRITQQVNRFSEVHDSVKPDMLIVRVRPEILFISSSV